MIITQERIPVHSSKKHQSLDFGIKNPAMVFKLLCDKIYKNPLRTLVQEYIANARDAHREVGKYNIPIHIYFPNDLSDKLIIKDFGPGLSPRRIEEVFIWLGESTKRETDDFTGGFGIGAKIGWAYTDSFTIVSNHNSIKTTYLAYIGENGVGKLDIMTKKPTDEPNGVEIHISIKEDDFDVVQTYVNRVCCFWKVRPKLFNYSDKFPKIKKPFGKSFTFIKSKVMQQIRSSGKNGAQEYVIPIVDGIMYSPIYYYGFIHKRVDVDYYHSLIMFFKTGEVDVGVNREEIQLSDKTKASVTRVYEQIRKDRAGLESRMLTAFNKLDPTKIDDNVIDEMASKFDHYKIKSLPINEYMHFNFDNRYGRMGIQSQNFNAIKFYRSEYAYRTAKRISNSSVTTIPFGAKIYMTCGKSRVTNYLDDGRYGVCIEDPELFEQTKKILEKYMVITDPPPRRVYKKRIDNILQIFNCSKLDRQEGLDTHALQEDRPYLFIFYHEKNVRGIKDRAELVDDSFTRDTFSNALGGGFKVPKIVILPKTKKRLMKYYDLTHVNDWYRDYFIPKVRCCMYESFKNIQPVDIKQNMSIELKNFLKLIWCFSNIELTIKDSYINEVVRYYGGLSRKRKLALSDNRMYAICNVVYPRIKKPRFLKMNQKRTKRIVKVLEKISWYMMRNYPLTHARNSNSVVGYSRNKLNIVGQKHIQGYLDMAYENLEEEIDGMAFIQDVHCLFV